MEWFRWFEGSTTDPKFAVVARKTGQPVAFVIAVWAQLLERASASKERGCIDGFDCEGADVALGLPDGAACAIVQALKEKGLIDEYRVCKWDERQPKREKEPEEAGKSSRRVREHRARKREEAENGSVDETECNGQKRYETDGNGLEEIRGEENNINTRVCLNARGQACAREASSVPEMPTDSMPEGEHESGRGDEPAAYDRQPSLAFDQFFEAYPEVHRGSRLEAEREWVALEANRALPGLPRILDALLAWEDSGTWQQQGGRYIPSAANFLKREYWQRKPPESLKPPESGRDRDAAAFCSSDRPQANTVTQRRMQDYDDMAKMLLRARRSGHAHDKHDASPAGQSGPALPAGGQDPCAVAGSGRRLG